MKDTSNNSLSVIIPVYNEAENLVELQQLLLKYLEPLDCQFEIIFVDDGSTDNSYQILQNIAKVNKNYKLIRFRKNFGQTAAMSAGIEYSKGEIIIFMDADLQNDPADIPLLLEKLSEGYDVVSGWRKNRKDSLFMKKIPSIIANTIIRSLSKVKIHDLGCTLKAYRREIIEEISLYGEMHRLLPVLANKIGAKITEIPVNHNTRKYGRSSYGLNRTYKVLFDFITVQFFGSFGTKPLYLYGKFAFASFFLSLCSGLTVILMKIYWGTDMTGNPILLLTVMFVLLAVILALMGIQSEVLVRIYHEQGKIKQYYIKETHNIIDMIV